MTVDEIKEDSTQFAIALASMAMALLGCYQIMFIIVDPTIDLRTLIVSFVLIINGLIVAFYHLGIQPINPWGWLS